MEEEIKEKMPTTEGIEAQKEKGVKKQYTLNFLLKPSMNTEEVDAYRATLNEKIQNIDGQIASSVCSNAPKHFAYPINKMAEGYLCECVFSVEPKNLKTIDGGLAQDPQIVRHMLEVKKLAKNKYRKRLPRTKADQVKPKETPIEETQEVKEKREKVSMEEIEKKLDEIIENI